MASTSPCFVVAAPLQDNCVTVTRRAVLAGVAAGALAGCRPHRSKRPHVPSEDLAALDQAIQGEHLLLARYDEAIARLDAVAAGRLSRARDRHTAHLQALTAVRRPSASPSPTAPTPSPAAGGRPPLPSLLAASSLSLRQTAVRVHSGRLAALLASVAAEHAADSGQDLGAQ
jgi:hypothetical protein